MGTWLTRKPRAAAVRTGQGTARRLLSWSPFSHLSQVWPTHLQAPLLFSPGDRKGRVSSPEPAGSLASSRQEEALGAGHTEWTREQEGPGGRRDMSLRGPGRSLDSVLTAGRGSEGREPRSHMSSWESLYGDCPTEGPPLGSQSSAVG